MAFFSPMPSSGFGLDPKARELIQQARQMGLGEDEIAQMLDSSGFNPQEYANDLLTVPEIDPNAQPDIIPPQVAATLASQPMATTPPVPDTPNNVRVGTGDKTYGDYNDPNVFTQRWNDAADAYGVPRDIAQGLLTTENAARDPFAVNPTPGSTAMGLGQLTDAARADYNKAHGTNFSRADFLDPDLNTDATFWYWTTRNGDTPLDKARAYNAGNTGAARGEGGDYAELVAKNAGNTGPLVGGGWNPNAARMNADLSGPHETMFANRGGATSADSMSVASAPPGYDEQAPTPQGRVLLEGESGDETPISSDPKESPGFFGKLMGALSGPLGEGLMGMGAGILGARGTYGNTFAAIGQGGAQGLEAYGYAQRRAQRDKEAAAEAKRQEARDVEARATREQTALANDLSLIQTLTKNRQFKAAAAYIARSPRLRERFGSNLQPEMLAGGGEKPDIHFYPDRVIAVDPVTLQATEIKIPGGPLKKQDDVNGIVTVKDGRKVLMSPRDGRVISDLGEDDGGEVNGVVRTEVNERGQPVNRLYHPRTGALISELGVPYDDSQSVEIQNADGSVTRIGKQQKGGRTGLPQARENKLWEHYDTWRNAKFVGEQLIGTKDEEGIYRGGALNKFDIGLLGELRKYTFGALSQGEAAMQLFGSSLESGSQRFVEQNMKRAKVPGKGDFTPSKWFNPNQSAIEYYGNMLGAIQAMSQNPDGRISDADMAIARKTLSLEGEWWTNLDVVRDKVAKAIAFAEEKGARAAKHLKVDPESGLPLEESGAPAPVVPDDTKDELPLSQTPGPPPPPAEPTPLATPNAAVLDALRKQLREGEVLTMDPRTGKPYAMPAEKVPSDWPRF